MIIQFIIMGMALEVDQKMLRDIFVSLGVCWKRFELDSDATICLGILG
jgi:hypothetical protein